MNKFFAFFFLIILSCSISSFADDVSEFEIDGIKMGDSLLDYMSEEEIKIQLEKNKYMFSHTDKKFIGIQVLGRSPELYEYIVVSIKRTGDLKYIIYSIRGMFDYPNPADCLKKQKTIVKDLSKMFENTKKDEWSRSPPVDSTGQSKVTAVSFRFKKGGSVSVLCHDYAKHVDLPSGLDVTVRNKEFQKWLEKY